MTEMYELEIKRKVRAIVMFGPATPTSGLRPAEYYSVIVDPNMSSPNGNFIRFGNYKGDEIMGWQRVEAMTVCEVLAEVEQDPISVDGYVVSPEARVTMRALK